MTFINETIKFCKAQTSAGIATCSDYATRVILNKLIGFGYVGSTFLGAVIGGIVNCCINYRWVFNTTNKTKGSVTWRYIIVWVGSVILNTLGTAFFKEVIHIKAYNSMLITSVLVAICWNYAMQRTFVFRNNKPKTKSDEL